MVKVNKKRERRIIMDKKENEGMEIMKEVEDLLLGLGEIGLKRIKEEAADPKVPYVKMESRLFAVSFADWMEFTHRFSVLKDKVRTADILARCAV
jgi:hypothetical protein